MNTQNISPREKEVLNLIAYERSTKEIAAELFLSPHTVISHRKNLMSKLFVKNAAGLVRKGFQLQLIHSIICLIIAGSLSAQLGMELRMDGVVVPKIDTSETINPTTGQLIYDTLSSAFWVYTGNQWSPVGGVSNRITDSVDNDSHITVEEHVGRDQVRIFVQGTERMHISEESVRWGENTFAADTVKNTTAWGRNSEATGEGSTA